MDIEQAFEELGLSQQASQAEAKAAYRMLAMRWHPDINSGAQTHSRMQRINMAYALVCQHLQTQIPKPTGALKPSNGFQAYDWRRGFSPSIRAHGKPLEDCVQRTLRVSMFEAAFGCIKHIHGRGIDSQVWMADVEIHAGTLDASVVEACDIRARSDARGLPRSFKLSVQIEKHPLFRLDQNRLSVNVPVSIWRWLLGGEITVPTLDGSTRVALPTRPAVLLVKNQGWPQPKAPNQRKPLFVVPKIIYPEQLRDEDRRMLQVLDVRSHMPEVQGWSRHVQAWMEP